MSTQILLPAVPDGIKRTYVRNAVKKIPFINCGRFSVTITTSNHDTKLRKESVRLHAHPFYEFSLIRQGVMGYRTKQASYQRGPGEVHFMPPGIPHGWTVIKAPLYVDNFMIAFHAMTPEAGTFIDDLPKFACRNKYSLAVSDEILRLYQEIDSELMQPDAFTEHHLPVIIYGIFYKVFRLNFSGSIAAVADEKQPPPSRTFRVFLSAKAIIDEQYMTNITQRSIADRVRVTPRYLNHIFEQVVRMPCGKYIQELKLLHAYSAIAANPDDKIREIAISLGYSDPLYFTRLFTKRFGVSPTEVRGLLIV